MCLMFNESGKNMDDILLLKYSVDSIDYDEYLCVN